MASWSSSDNSRDRRGRTRPFFRDHSPDDIAEMFFNSATTPSSTFPRSHHLVDRIGSSVFDDFPGPRLRPSELSRIGAWRRRDSGDSPPSTSGPEPQRSSDSIAEPPGGGASSSRCSTPETTTSSSGHSAASHDDELPVGRRRRPKVHHIPIHVEPRDGQQHGFVLTPLPVAGSPPPAPDRVRPIPVVPEMKQEEPLPVAPEATTEPLPVPPPPPPGRKSPLDVVADVRQEVDELGRQVEAGVRGDKHFRFLDEMLTRNLIRLDTIETEGDDELRQARRNVIGAINNCIRLLEEKRAAPPSQEEVEQESEDVAAPPPEVEQESQDVPPPPEDAAPAKED